MATVNKNDVEVKVEEEKTPEETGVTFKDKAKQAASKAGAICKKMLPFGGGLIGGFILGRATAPKSETPDEDDDIVVTDDGDNVIV